MNITTAPLLQGSILQTQIDLETDAVTAGIIRYRDLAKEATERGDGASLKPAERFLLHWFVTLKAAIALDQRRLRKQEVADRGANLYAPMMLALEPEQLAVITMHETVSACMAAPHGVIFRKLCHEIGRSVIAEAALPLLKEHKMPLRDDARPNEKPRSALTALTYKCRKINPMKVNWWANKTLEDPPFSQKVCTHIGARLFWLLQGVASAVGYDKPHVNAFHTSKKKVDARRTKGMVYMNDLVFDEIARGHTMRQALRPRYQPMVVKPYPWLTETPEGGRTEGGYVKIRTPFISKPTHAQKRALASADLKNVYECLTAVTDQDWSVDTTILKLQAQAWAEGGGIAGIPRANDIEKPTKPLDFASNEEAFLAWKKQAASIHGQNQRMKSDRFGFLQKLDLAQRMSKFAEIYFPHQLDFRGRTYPIPIHLNHHGADICRGLLQFAKPKDASGPEAQRWLKIHAANCYGIDKVSFKDRVQWVDDHMTEIHRTVKDPLNNDWWQAADGGDQPWQFLSACFALTDPAAAARIPVGQDGTCNGLQHYAALGRDREGAGAVNMLAKHEDAGPDDIYSRVAKLVHDAVKIDAAMGNAIALTLHDHITRSLVKQPTMTSVYGVTAVGARDQLKEKLKKLPVPKELRFEASKYLATVTMEAIGSVCVKAREIMDYLRVAATRIAHEGHSVDWVTELGLPVVQPYRLMRKVRIDTMVQNITLRVEDESLPVATRRQVDGTPPNYIHSVDSTHKFMTARACRRKNVDFAHVHDKFLSHAATSKDLGIILREEMIALHREPLLDKLVAYWRGKYPDIHFAQPPETGTYDINELVNAPYFFS